MSLRLTPEIVEAAYEFLRATPPFKRWRLPHPDEIEFHITRHPENIGDCDGATLRISALRVAHTRTLIETLAHEMVHLHHFQKGLRGMHGREFQRDWRLVAKHHGFDPKLQ